MTPTHWMHNIHIMTMDPNQSGALGVINQGVIVWADGQLIYVGSADGAPSTNPEDNVIDGQGAWVSPGLVDCHTHLIWGGNRAGEFEALLEGASYAEIAKQGGGIMSTVTATRALSEQQLFDAALPRLHRLMETGVTTVEIKSGYGLDDVSERAMLRVMTRLQAATGIQVMRTCLAAHALPPEYKGRQDDYVAWIADHLLPSVAAEGLADAVDVFCEEIAFTAAQAETLWRAAQRLGLQVKGHVGQLSVSGGADVLAQLGGLSADHVEYLTDQQVTALSQAGVAAVLLPGAFYFLRETQMPPIDSFRRLQVPMAIATDMNPGSSPLGSLLTAANMACVLWRMTPAEAWLGITRHAAMALGLGDRKGQLQQGYDADFVLWQVENPVQVIHELGIHRPHRIWLAGKLLLPNPLIAH